MTGHTRLLGVVGWPIAHTRSPAMQNAALRSLGLDLVYLPFAVRPGELAQALAGARALGLRGLNVTIPHKEAALALCEPDAIAREVGAVNTLSFDDDAVRGTNTDVHGFRMLMAEAGCKPGGSAVILGAGGAARAVVAALRTTGHRQLTIVSRRGAPLTVGGVQVSGLAWESSSLAARLAHADVLIDATPRGLDPNAPAIDLSPLPAGAVVLDLVVRRETALVHAARARGLKAATGTAMLLHQGAAALERWTSRPAPVEIMRAALEASLE
jgi:shikimate dehydrogenase